MLGKLEFVRECHQIRDLSINSFQSGLGNSILINISTNCLVNLELGSLHEMNPDILVRFFSEKGPGLKGVSLAYDPTLMPIRPLVTMLTYASKLQRLTLGLDSSTARKLRTSIANVRRGWPPGAQLYSPDTWSLNEILRVIGAGLISLTLPFHGQWAHRLDSLPKYGIAFLESFAYCQNLEILSFSTFLDDVSDKASRGSLQDCTVQDLISRLSKLRLVDVSRISITGRDFKDLMSCTTLEYVQLGHGAVEGGVNLSDIAVKGPFLMYDSGLKALIPVKSRLTLEGQAFTMHIAALTQLHGV